MKNLIFIVLNIYLLNLFTIQAQELKLKIEAEDSLKTTFINSLGYKKKHSSFKSLSSEVDSVSKELQKIGFINLETRPVVKNDDSLFVAKMLLKNQYDSIIIKIPEKNFSLKQLLRIDKAASATQIMIPISETERALKYLNALQTQNGTPFSAVQLVNIKTTGNKVSANLFATYSPSRTIDAIKVKGYENFPTPFVTYGARIYKGQVFNKDVLQQRYKRLNNLGFAKTKKPPEVLFTKDSTTVYLYLEKKQANTFDGFLGFSNNPENNDIQFNGYLDLQLTNNLNFGETLNLSYKSDGGEQVQFKVNTELPYLFKTPVGLLLNLEIFRRDSTFVTVDQAARLNYKLTNNINIFAGYKATTSNLLDDDVNSGSVAEDFNSNFLNFGGEAFEQNNSLLFPLKYRVNLNIQAGRRDTDLFRDNQIRGSLYGQYLFSLNNRNSIFVSNHSSALFSEDYLSNELFRFGGILSIRGFEENSIDASLLNTTQTEYRYLLSPTLYAHSVIDFAYYENDVLNLKEQLVSFGVGLGLNTNSGLLKLVFANGRTGSQSFDFDNTKVHLSFSSQF